MFSEEKLSEVGQKTNCWYKIFLLNTSYGLEYEKTVSVNFLIKSL